MTEEEKVCYICPSTKHVEDHHYDCKGGELSPETVPLCKRCHRTYHDLGVEWFEDQCLDKAIEIENKRRQIVYDSLRANEMDPVSSKSQSHRHGYVDPVKPLILLRREDIQHSDYFNKTHGIKPSKKPEPAVKEKATFSRTGIEPLPGWKWYYEHFYDPPPPCEMVIYYDGKKVAEVTGSIKRGEVRRIMRSLDVDK